MCDTNMCDMNMCDMICVIGLDTIVTVCDGPALLTHLRSSEFVRLPSPDNRSEREANAPTTIAALMATQVGGWVVGWVGGWVYVCFGVWVKEREREGVCVTASHVWQVETANMSVMTRSCVQHDSFIHTT